MLEQTLNSSKQRTHIKNAVQDTVWKHLLQPQGFSKTCQCSLKTLFLEQIGNPLSLRLWLSLVRITIHLFSHMSRMWQHHPKHAHVTSGSKVTNIWKLACQLQNLSRLNLMYAIASRGGVCSWNTIFCIVYTHLHFSICVLLRLWLRFIHKMSAKSKKTRYIPNIFNSDFLSQQMKT